MKNCHFSTKSCKGYIVSLSKEWVHQSPPFFFISYSGNRKKFFRNIFAPKNMKGSDSNGRSCLILNSSILRTTIFSWFSFSCHWFEITASIFDARINEEAPATLLNSKGDNLKAGWTLSTRNSTWCSLWHMDHLKIFSYVPTQFVSKRNVFQTLPRSIPIRATTYSWVPHLSLQQLTSLKIITL